MTLRGSRGAIARHGIRLDVTKAHSFADVYQRFAELLPRYHDLFPIDRNARIVLKPNFNANMNGLTGNTTDLRIISALIRYLMDMGYRHITIAEGTNSGFYRNNISVLKRLKADELAEYYGVPLKDLNYDAPHELFLSGGMPVQVSRTCVEADFLINMPKLKTHFEMGMSVCLKNLMGCLIGQENKKKMHLDLAENILRLNRQLVPDLHIVDGLIGMEGLGPTRGTPVKMNLVIIGTDPFFTDLACARLAGFARDQIGTLNLAEEKGILDHKYNEELQNLNLAEFSCAFSPPEAGALARFIHSPKRQKYFLKLRNTPFFNYLAATDWFGKLLFISGLRQDVFLKEESECKGLELDQSACDGCGLCQDYCPVGLDPVKSAGVGSDGCIYCLYCYMMCPGQALVFRGTLGFLNEQIRQYGHLIRNLESHHGMMN